MAEKKHRLVLTSDELAAVKDALLKTVPTAADVLLTHFGG